MNKEILTKAYNELQKYSDNDTLIDFFIKNIKEQLKDIIDLLGD